MSNPLRDRLRHPFARGRAAAATADGEHVSVPAGASQLPSVDGPEVLTVDAFRQRFAAGALEFEHVDRFVVTPEGLIDTTLEPTSAEYREQVLASWARISGRAGYVAEEHETFDVDPAIYLAKPYPYSSSSPVEVSRYFGAVAAAIARVGAVPPARIVEFGSGWGHLALALAATGFEVTAVDLNAPSVELLRRRAAALDVPISVVQASFLGFEPPEPVDAIVFFEAFHHCDRPFDLLDRCVGALAPSGRLLFVADAFYDHFYAPWGIRLDGSATFMAAQQGWLELGFQRAFFEEQLHRRGLRTTWEVVADLGPYGTFLTAELADA